MQNRWNDSSAGTPTAQLIHQSHLVGAEESLVLWGGGNNSVKTTATDLLGRPIDVMLIKSSGSDMKTITPAQFPAVRLDYIAPLRSRRDDMTDQEMVDYLARCLVDPGGARPSIETLLHAFLPAAAVLHTHADAILALTNNRGREDTVRKCFGDQVLRVPYRRPGFMLSREVGEHYDRQPEATGLVLMNHGLITWGATVQEAYDRHIELVTKAEEFLSSKSSVPLWGAAGPGGEINSHSAIELAPTLRGALSQRRSVVLELDQSPEVMAFVNRDDTAKITQAGAATPDHLLHTKRLPLHVKDPDSIRTAVSDYVEQYTKTYERQRSEYPMLDPTPRVILVRGVGMFTSGKDARTARIVRDVYRHTIDIMTAAEAAGGYESLGDEDAFHAEYWPLELYKLTLLPKDRELAGKVAVVTGAATGIGRAVAIRLAEEGAHVVVSDIDEGGARGVADEIVAKQGLRRAMPLRMDVTQETDVEGGFAEVCRSYGGVDVVVSNAGVASFGTIETVELAAWDRSFAINTRGHFLVARAAMRVMRAQGTGGSLVFNASKNVTAPGKEFGAYSVSKAAEAQLCRIVALEGGEIGIRANMVNPDAIFGDSRFWSDEMKRMRAQNYGIEAEALPDFYRKRTLLNVTVTAEDVAEAVLFLAGPRSGKTTGAMLPVDGGVKEAFPR